MKVLFLATALLFTVRAMSQVPTNGLVASYPFTGNANDASPNANNGTVHGATLTTDRFGNANSAYNFDGSDYISVANAVGINNNEYSYSVWVKAASLPAFNQGMQIFEFGTSVNNIYGQLLSLNNSYVGASGFTVSSGNTDGSHTVFSDDFSASINTWYNLVLTRSNTTISLYVNGQLTKAVDVTGLTAYYNNPLEMFIGTRAQNFQYWQGAIDDICVYNRILTPQEISGLAGVQPACPVNRQADYWYFGNGAGIHFNGNTATALTNGQLYTREGVATLSDQNGNLLFYTDGSYVYNRNNVVMPNGSGLYGNASSTQSAVIVQHPGSTSKYYIFTADVYSGSGGYSYSEIDMTLDGGRGDVITATKNISIFSGSTEKLTATRHANGVDTWIILHERNNTNFRAYLLSAGGLSSAVVSNVGSSTAGSWNDAGYMKFNKAGSVLVNVFNGLNGIAEVFNFDKSTGVLSGPSITISPLVAGYGVEFSASGKYLYISQLYSTVFSGSKGSVFQYNMQAGNNAAVNASKVTLIASSTSLGYGALQMAPDGKIYVAKENGFNIGVSSLDLIANPDEGGSACNYSVNAFNLGGKTALIGFPNFIWDNYTVPAVQLTGPSSLCLNDTASYKVVKIPGYSYNWTVIGNSSTISQNDSILKLKFNVSSSVNISVLITGCGQSGDTMEVAVHPLPGNFLGKDTLLCENSILLNPGSYTEYLWQDGSTAATYSVTTDGTYTLKVKDNWGCIGKDTLEVTIVPEFDIDLSDLTLCAGDTAVLDAGVDFTSYLWSDGSVSQILRTLEAGEYSVKVTRSCRTAEDTVSVYHYPTSAPPAITGVASSYCVSEGTVPLVASPAGGVFTGQGVHGNVFDPRQLALGVHVISYYYSDVHGCKPSTSVIVDINDGCFFIPNLVTPNGDNLNDTFHVIGLSPGFTLEVYNRWNDLVYKKTDYDNSFNGDALSGGVYYFSLLNSTKSYKGWVHIMK